MSRESRDVFGLAPFGESLHTLTKAAVDGAAAFLGRICLLAAEEFGLLLRDKISRWRAANAVAVVQGSRQTPVDFFGLQVPPAGKEKTA